MIDPITQYILEQESKLKKVVDFFKNMGIKIYEIYFENKKCKEIRMKNRNIYLLHGTRPQYVSSIKNKGLLVDLANKRSMEDNDINLSGNMKVIWFSSSVDVSSPEFGVPGKDIVFLIAKLETKYLKNFLGGTYIYSKNVPSKDLIWQNDKRFKQIIKQSNCLQYKE